MMAAVEVEMLPPLPPMSTLLPRLLMYTSLPLPPTSILRLPRPAPRPGLPALPRPRPAPAVLGCPRAPSPVSGHRQRRRRLNRLPARTTRSTTPVTTLLLPLRPYLLMRMTLRALWWLLTPCSEWLVSPLRLRTCCKRCTSLSAFHLLANAIIYPLPLFCIIYSDVFP